VGRGVGGGVLGDPQMIKLITAGRVKTDPRDAVHLAKLLAAGLLPEVWVPPQPVRELRQLVAHREGLVTQRTRLRNRLQSVLMAHHIVPQAGELFSKESRRWWESLTLSGLEKLLVKQQLAQLETVDELIKEVERELIERSQLEPWANQITYLIQLPGIGVLSALVLLSAIGDITRFATPKQLVGYSGLGASIYSSGQTVRTGGITKQGRKELRRVMVEAAWVAVEHSAHWKAQFERLAAKKSKGKAIVAIARKLLVVVWHVLTHHQADTYAEEKKVALKFFKWSNQLKRAGRRGLSRGEFIRRELSRLELGRTVREVYQGQRRYLIPPPPGEDEGEGELEIQKAAS
jgi:transposase